MTSRKDRDKIPAGWKYVPVFSRGGYYSRHGTAMNSCQWLKPVIWAITTNEGERSAVVKCYWTYCTDNGKGYSHAPATLTIVGETLTVEKTPWRIQPRDGESPILSAIRWVEQQENAAEKYGSK